LAPTISGIPDFCVLSQFAQPAELVETDCLIHGSAPSGQLKPALKTSDWQQFRSDGGHRYP